MASAVAASYKPVSHSAPQTLLWHHSLVCGILALSQQALGQKVLTGSVLRGTKISQDLLSERQLCDAQSGGGTDRAALRGAGFVHRLQW